MSLKFSFWNLVWHLLLPQKYERIEWRIDSNHKTMEKLAKVWIAKFIL